MWAAVIVLSLISAVNSISLQQAANGTVTVQTADGVLRGYVLTSIWNRTYYSFRSVPYAQPPLGDLRFKSPRPVQPWAGVRDAFGPASFCPQVGFSEYNEDCLHVNIYVPQLAVSPLPADGLTVMAYIHGGQYTSSSGSWDLVGPDNLMNETIILVTFNYRLGALGFLAVEHPNMTSNAALKDQVAALRWIKRNIANFGGNPNSITVFGESAGGVSVELHMMSPMSRGLFNRAISQSGCTMVMDFLSNFNGTLAALNLARAIGYTGDDIDGLVSFLYSASAQDIVNAQWVITPQGVRDSNTSVILPHIDARVQEGDEVFLTDTPERLLQAGRFYPIPYMSGSNSAESKNLLNNLTEATLNDYNEHPERFIPLRFNISIGSTEARELGARIKRFYFGNQSVSTDTIQQFIDAMSDVFMIYPVHRSGTYHINNNKAPFFTYLFTYDGTLYNIFGNTTVKGPAHYEDLLYVFTSHLSPYNPTSDDIAVIQHFTNLWVDFARFGEPTARQSVNWTAATRTHHTYLQLDRELSVHEDMLRERMAFWDEMYDIYSNQINTE